VSRRTPVSNLPALPAEPSDASRLLLSLDERTASAVFRKLTTDAQLSVINATVNPREREALYYLVPDCRELVRESRVESLLEIINTVFGTGLSCGILSAVSAQQFAEMFEMTAFRGGVPDTETVEVWIAELTGLDGDELTELLSNLDVELVAELFRGRVDVPVQNKGMVLASGVVELEQVEFDDENSRLMGELLWAADPAFFIAVLRYLISQDEEFADVDEDTESADDDDPIEVEVAHEVEDFDLERLDDLLSPARRSEPKA
jgi:hypothetical protein